MTFDSPFLQCTDTYQSIRQVKTKPLNLAVQAPAICSNLIFKHTVLNKTIDFRNHMMIHEEVNKEAMIRVVIRMLTWKVSIVAQFCLWMK